MTVRFRRAFLHEEADFFIERREKMKLNQKAVSLGQTRSCIREIFEYAQKRKQLIGKENVFDFSLGNPSIEAPECVNKELVNLIETQNSVSLHGYTSAQGAKELREKIAQHIKEDFNYTQNPDLIYVTCGAAAGLTSTLGAIINEGDEVIVFAPFFPEYKVFVEGVGGVIKVVQCKAPDFKLPLEELKESITEKTKAVILNSPNNPTGVVVTKQELETLSQILNECENTVYLISDEPYRELCYDNKAPFVPHFYKNTIVCYSFSKSLSLPGERIGYVLVGDECEEKENLFFGICGAAREKGYVCAPSLFQHLLTRVIGEVSDVSLYKQNRDILCNALKEIGYTFAKPDGAFYLFVKALEDDAKAFCETAKEYELMLVPSDDFGTKGWVRISYCVDKDTIMSALPSFKALFLKYKEKKNG